MADLELKIGATLDEQTKTAFKQLEQLMISLGTGNAKNILNNIFSGATKDIDKFHLSLEKLKSKSGEFLDKGAVSSINKAIGQLKFHQTLAMKTVNDLMQINMALEKDPQNAKLLRSQTVAVGKLSRADTRLTDAKTGVSRAFISAEESIRVNKKYEADFTALLNEEEKKRLAIKKKYEDDFNKLVRDDEKKKASEKKKKIQEVNTFDKQQYDALVRSKVEAEKKQRDAQRAINQSIADAIKERVKQEALDKKALDSQKEQLAKQKEYAKILNEINGKYKNRYGLQKAIQVKKQEILALEKTIDKVSGDALIKNKKDLEDQKLRLKALTQIHDSTKSTISDALHGALSMTKIVNRMSFVLTAQLSYAVFGQISRFFTEGLRDAKAFEQQLTRIASITRGQNQGIVRQSALQSIGMGFTSADTTQALYQATSGQFSTAESAKLASESARMAIAGFTTQAEAMDALITVLRSYKMETSDAGRVSDWFFKTIELGKTELKDLAPNLGKVTSVASLLGFSLDEVGAVLSTMTMAGVKTNVAITSLRQLLLNLINPSKEASQIYAQYGINMDLSRIRAQGLGETLKQLNVLNDEQIATLAGSRTGYMALASVMNNMSMYQENYNKIVDAGGSSQKAFQDQTETTAFKLNKMRGTLVRAGMEFGEVLLKFSFMLEPLELLVTGLNNKVASTVAIMGSLALVIYTKVRPALLSLTATSAVIGGIGVAIGLATIAWGMYVKKQREAQQASQDAIDTKVSELSKERGELAKNNEMLKTYIGLKEREGKGENLTKKEKDLLNISQKELNKTYGNSMQTLDDYRSKLNQNIIAHRKLSKEIINFSAEQAKIDYLKSVGSKDYYSESQKTPSASEFGHLSTGAFRLIGMGQRGLTPDSARRLLSEIENFRKEEFRITNKYVKASSDEIQKNIGKGITPMMYVNRMAEGNLNNEINKYKKQLSALEQYARTVASLDQSKKDIIDEDDINDIKTSGGDYEDKKSKIEEEKRTLYQAQLARYRLEGTGLDKVLTARDNYLKVISKSYVKEKETYDTQNEVLDAISASYRDKTSSEINMLDKKAGDISAITEIYKNIDNEYNKQIAEMIRVNEKADVVEKVRSEQQKKATEGKNLIIKLTYEGKQIATEKALENVSMLEADTEMIRLKTPAEIRDEKQAIIEELIGTIGEGYETDLSRDFIEREKANIVKEYNRQQKEIVEGAIKDVKTTSFIGKFIGGESPEEIRDKKLAMLAKEGKDLPDSDKQSIQFKIQQEYQQDITNQKKKADEMTLAETKTLISNMSQMWDSYLDNRLAQIEKESQARMEAIDKQAKFEFKSSLWIESQKEKATKKEEAEKKKIAKLRKLTNMAELTSNYAVAMMTAYKQLGVFAPVLMALITANYGLGMKMISAQKYEQGGIIKGRRHSQGGVIIEAEGGEAIFSRKATSGNEAVLSGMNKSLSNGASFSEAVAKNAPRANNSGQNQADMSAMTKMLSGVVDAVKDIKMNVVLQGEFLDNIKLSKKVEQGNRMRSVL